MATTTQSFASVQPIIDYPDFLAAQLKSFKRLFQLATPSQHKKKEGLYQILHSIFPLKDTRENFELRFLDYTIEPPRYTPEECVAQGVTYATPLKLKLELWCKDKDVDDVIQDVFLGDIPYMTDKGSFIINGVERLVISQIHRAPGVFFAQTERPDGTTLYSAKVIPVRGTWVEFLVDAYNTMYAYIDRKKKVPITTLLRAIGYGKDKDLLGLFDLTKPIKNNKNTLQKHLGSLLAERILHNWVEEFVDDETGEVISIERNKILLDRQAPITEENLQTILESNRKTVLITKENTNPTVQNIIQNTLQKDEANSEKEAVEHIYRQLRGVEVPDEQTARDAIHNLFLSNKRYDLGTVGRYKINQKLKLNTPATTNTLTTQDILKIIQHLIHLVESRAKVDDIDHLSNRRIKLIGEQFYNQLSLGLNRMARSIREKMNNKEHETLTPLDLVNARTLTITINSFFNANPLSQYLDKVNLLSELSHKRRISALGPGGLSRDRSGFEVRNIHHTHYGRICPLETPEGANIGLISSLASHARINENGFIETPYRKVESGVITSPKKVHYLTAEEEKQQYIAPATTPLDKHHKIIPSKIRVRHEGDTPIISATQVTYIDVLPGQIASVPASQIPFLEHNEATRVLMGANHLKQALPLIQPEAPIVGTGTESKIVKDSRTILYAKHNGIVQYVDAQKIIVQYHPTPEEQRITFYEKPTTYSLTKFTRTNQNTCINLTPLVKKEQTIQKGQPLCQGYATQNGQLALGRNLVVAFMPWQGYNFEDAIVVSERVIQQDLLTSIKITEFKKTTQNTKLGPEEFTAEIPSLNEQAIEHLGQDGIVKEGTQVKPGDRLIGKITPQSAEEVTSAEKAFLHILFGDNASNVKDESLRAPASTTGTVIHTQLLQRNAQQPPAETKKQLTELQDTFYAQLTELKDALVQKLAYLLAQAPHNPIKHVNKTLLTSKTAATPTNLQTKLFPAPKKQTHTHYDPILNLYNFFDQIRTDNWTKDNAINAQIQTLIHNYKQRKQRFITQYKHQKFTIEVGNPLPSGILKAAKVYLAKKNKLKIGDKLSGRHGNKGIVSTIVPVENMPYLADGTPVDIVLNPLGVPSRMNLGQIFELLLGMAGRRLGEKYTLPIFDSAKAEDIHQKIQQANLPEFSRHTLYDGFTGQPFDQKVTVGNMYFLKLNHLVDDKMHARSIGPYAMITHQPLGGKSQSGGQRLGEMEVWALEAYGASHTLQEFLTVKSDHQKGRTKTYEAIVKGDNILNPNTPTASFNVLKRELNGLGLKLTATRETE